MIVDIKFKIIFVGRKDRIPESMKEVIKRVEAATKNNEGMTLQVSLDYGSKDDLIHAFENA